MKGLRERVSQPTCGGSGVGSENDAAVVSDADDRRSHGVRGVEIHIVHLRHSTRERERGMNKSRFWFTENEFWRECKGGVFLLLYGA